MNSWYTIHSGSSPSSSEERKLEEGWRLASLELSLIVRYPLWACIRLARWLAYPQQMAFRTRCTSGGLLTHRREAASSGVRPELPQPPRRSLPPPASFLMVPLSAPSSCRRTSLANFMPLLSSPSSCATRGFPPAESHSKNTLSRRMWSPRPSSMSFRSCGVGPGGSFPIMPWSAGRHCTSPGPLLGAKTWSAASIAATMTISPAHLRSIERSTALARLGSSGMLDIALPTAVILPSLSIASRMKSCRRASCRAASSGRSR
mmetsp:Transcript_31626/g.89870  ORF Transcript_31626/g.89870 Transcript_31626/m.89870 type:complete len:261 (+) Transcript_31626:49-831(+)